jgi:hypothetical protein
VDDAGVMFHHGALADVVTMVLVVNLLVAVALVVVGGGVDRLSAFVVYFVKVEFKLEFGFPERVVDQEEGCEE